MEKKRLSEMTQAEIIADMETTRHCLEMLIDEMMQDRDVYRLHMTYHAADRIYVHRQTDPLNLSWLPSRVPGWGLMPSERRQMMQEEATA